MEKVRLYTDIERDYVSEKKERRREMNKQSKERETCSENTRGDRVFIHSC